MPSENQKKKTDIVASAIWGYSVSLLFSAVMLKPFFMHDIFFLFREFFIYILRYILPGDLAWQLDRSLYLLIILSASGFICGLVTGIISALLKRLLGKSGKRRGPQGLEGALVVSSAWVCSMAFLKIWEYNLKKFPLLALTTLGSFSLILILYYTLKRILPRFTRPSRRVAAILVAVLSLILFFDASPRMPREKPYSRAKGITDNGRKLLLIGIDGASWNLLTPLIEEGEMPVFADLMKNGAHGFLRSFKPTMSPVIWTSMATGKNPEKHGIKNFIVVRPGTTESSPVTSNLIMEPTIWEMFSAFDFKVAVNGWYVSWPAGEVNGTVISDLAVHPRISKMRTYPEDLADIVDASLSRFNAGEKAIFSEWFGFNPKPDDYENFSMSRAMEVFIQSFRKDMITLETALKLIDLEGQGKLTSLYFVGTDRVQHKFFKYLWLQRHPSESKFLFEAEQEEIDEFGEIIEDYLRFVDYGLGEMLKKIDLKKTDIFIVSDHGFGPVTDKAADMYTYDANPLFEALNLLVYGDAGEGIDLEKSTLYDAGNLAWIPVKDVYFTDQAHAWTYEKKNETAELLSELRTDSGQPVFKAVRILQGAAESSPDPDLKIVFQNNIYGQKIVRDNVIFPVSSFLRHKGNTGDHRINGVFLAAGPDIAVNKFIHDVSVLDITPTLCYLAGVPLTRDMDGRISGQVIKKTFLENNSALMMEGWSDITGQTGVGRKKIVLETMGADMGDGVEEVLLEEMRALGYIQ